MSSRGFRVVCGLSLVVIAGCAGVIGLGDYTIHDEDAVDASVADAPPAALDVVVPKPDVVVRPPFTCPDGQVISVDRCFFLNATPLDHASAKAACAEAGAHLAVIRNEDENVRAASVGGELDAARWIGLEGPATGSMNDRAQYGWVTGEPVDYSKWHDGDPNSDASCIVFYWNPDHVTDPSQLETWADRTCTDKYASICEQP